MAWGRTKRKRRIKQTDTQTDRNTQKLIETQTYIRTGTARWRQTDRYKTYTNTGRQTDTRTNKD